MISPFQPVELVNIQRLPLEGIERISVAYIAEGITLRVVDDGALTLREYLNTSAPEMFARIALENGILSITHGERPVLGVFLRGHIELDLPSAYFGALELQTVSGAIEVKDRLVLDDLTLHSTSGSIALGDVTAGTVSLVTISGAISAKELQAVANVHSTSGSLRVADAYGSGTYRTISGGIDVLYREVIGDLSASSTSGGIRLSVPRTLSFMVTAHSVSGRIDIPFAGSFSGGTHAVEGIAGDAPQVRIELQTVSGGIRVLPLA